MSTTKRPDFGDVLQVGDFFSGLKGLLHTTGVEITAYIFGYLTVHRWDASTVHRFLKLSLVCCVTDIYRQLSHISISYYLTIRLNQVVSL
jgi:hypothetical protein